MSSKTKKLLVKLSNAAHDLPTGTHWRHYKGGVYKIYDHVILTDSGEIGVEYYRVDGPDFNQVLESEIHFVRPIAEWFDTVKPDNVPRFERAVSRKVWVTENEAL